MTEEIFFRPNVKVEWSDHAREKFHGVVELLGPGPFTVRTVTPVADNLCECSCHPANTPCPDDDGCGHTTLREKVGCQWLDVIRGNGGETIGPFGSKMFKIHKPPAGPNVPAPAA